MHAYVIIPYRQISCTSSLVTILSSCLWLISSIFSTKPPSLIMDLPMISFFSILYLCVPFTGSLLWSPSVVSLDCSTIKVLLKKIFFFTINIHRRAVSTKLKILTKLFWRLIKERMSNLVGSPITCEFGSVLWLCTELIWDCQILHNSLSKHAQFLNYDVTVDYVSLKNPNNS